LRAASSRLVCVKEKPFRYIAVRRVRNRIDGGSLDNDIGLQMIVRLGPRQQDPQAPPPHRKRPPRSRVLRRGRQGSEYDADKAIRVSHTHAAGKLGRRRRWEGINE